ncbi:hypothetical protein M405DRAFT_897462 [Rhizopogon salebrosus TDB-379]|nr:hypothetical protein M405DRAFT_897462 [Rhizopogon salebrosus TDB-379]
MSYYFPSSRVHSPDHAALYRTANPASPRTPDRSYRVSNPASSRTPDQSYRTTNPVSPRTPAQVYRTSIPASPRTPDGPSYRAANPAPLQLLTTPGSNHLRFRLPSFSSITQPVFHSPSYHRSRAASSTTRVQPQTNSVVRAPSSPSRTDGSSGRHRTVSSGPSMRPSEPGTTLHSSPSALRTHRSYTKSTRGSHTAQQHSQRSPALKKPAAPQQQHPMLRDMGLIAAVTAARENGMNADLEFLWYPVWVIAIKDWMFPNSNTATVACNVAPQYVLSHMYRTEGCTKLKRQWVIPDFAQILQQVHTFSNGTRKLGRQKVILMVENKPTRPRKSFLLSPNPFVDAEDQITKQAVFAFMADSSLHVIGVILAFGARWKYVEFYRPSATELEDGGRGWDVWSGEAKIGSGRAKSVTSVKLLPR